MTQGDFRLTDGGFIPTLLATRIVGGLKPKLGCDFLETERPFWTIGGMFEDFLRDSFWDEPFFKRLAPNDTGQTSGHQGGVVIPASLRCYFPGLDESAVTRETPTVDQRLSAELYIGERLVRLETVRYQFQTWGGTRSPESRLTGNLGALRSRAEGGDFLLSQRSKYDLSTYRIILIPNNSEEYASVSRLVNNRPWGALYEAAPPISRQEIVEARDTLSVEVNSPFVLLRNDITRRPVARQAIARETVFRDTLISQYSRKCAISGISLTTGGMSEVQAAHVVALSDRGADDPRNGFTLTATLHWAFDKGLFVIDSDRRVLIPRAVAEMPLNDWLVQFRGGRVLEAMDPALRTEQAAFDFHRSKYLRLWGEE